MREVNNNTANSSNNIGFQGVQPKNSKDIVIPSVETEEVTDLGKMPSEVIGRSQVSQSFLKKDIAFMKENPELVENANRLFDYLVSERGFSYEKAAEVIHGFVEEFPNRV